MDYINAAITVFMVAVIFLLLAGIIKLVAGAFKKITAENYYDHRGD